MQKSLIEQLKHDRLKFNSLIFLFAFVVSVYVLLDDQNKYLLPDIVRATICYTALIISVVILTCETMNTIMYYMGKHE